MAVARTSYSGSIPANRRTIFRDSDQSEDNTALTVSTESGKLRRFLFATVKYTTNVSVTVTATLNSAVGAAWDAEVGSVALSTKDTGVILPDGEILIGPSDTLDVLAPAGGAGETSAVVVYTETLD